MNLIDLADSFAWREEKMGRAYSDAYDTPLIHIMPVSFRHDVLCWWSEDHERFLLGDYPKGEDPSTGEIWGFGQLPGWYKNHIEQV
jgi:hypothetical protein